MRVTYALGAELLVMSEAAPSRDAAMRLMEVAVSSGRAAEKFQEIVAAQGGDPAVVDDPGRLPQSAECELYAAERSGVIARIEPRAIGDGVTAMRGGRRRIDDRIDPAVGFVIGVRAGDYVRQGEPVATIFARDEAGVDAGRLALRSAVQIADEAELPLPLISHRVSVAGAEPYLEETADERVVHRDT
jgi:pyrimidine-nucleoside phosphorylase